MTTNDQFLSLMAIGDAYGMKYEFADHDIPVSADELFYGPHPKLETYIPGRYTDDTQMSLANAELLLRKNAADITSRDFIIAWLETFKRDPRPGYGKRMHAHLTEAASPETFVVHLNPHMGFASGAAMRAAPFGLMENPDDVKKLTRMQAVITHDTSVGINSALAVALATHFIHHGGRPEFMTKFVDRELGCDWDSEKYGRTDQPDNSLVVARHALNALEGQNNFASLLLSGASQARVADTDTVCAIAAAIASRSPEIDKRIPAPLREIENGRYGYNYLRAVDVALLQKFRATDKYAKLTF